MYNNGKFLRVNMSNRLCNNTCRIMVSSLVILFVLMFMNASVATADDGIPIVIKGKVTDKFSGKPTELEMVFVSEDGSKTKCNPNILDGHYQQVLTSGKSYTVYFVHFDVAREMYSINIPIYESYQEIERDWQVKKLAVGNHIYDDNAFLDGSAELSPEGILIIKQFSNILKFNRGAKFDLIVSHSATEKKNAKLMQDRIEALKKLPELSKYMSKINIIASEKGKFNFSLKVTEIVDPLKKR